MQTTLAKRLNNATDSLPEIEHLDIKDPVFHKECLLGREEFPARLQFDLQHST